MNWPELPKINLIAFDPGGSTGIVEVIDGDIAFNWTLSYQETMEFLTNAPDDLNNRVWVVEQFVLYPWRSAGMSFSTIAPARLIGAIDLTCRARGIKMVEQMASAAKQFATDDKLKHYGWYDAVCNKHERDAARHALLYLMKTYNQGADSK